MDPDDRLHILQLPPMHLGDDLTLLTIDGDTTSTTWLNSPRLQEVLLGDFVIDATGTMHMCYSGDSGEPGPSETIVHGQFTEFGDWEELSVPELNPGLWSTNEDIPCSLAVSEDGTVVWMSAYVAEDVVARIEDGVATIIPAVVPTVENSAITDITLDELEQPIATGMAWPPSLPDSVTYFVMRLVDGAWQLEHSFNLL